MPGRIQSQMEPIPGYRLLERLGRGGFGEVWKAEAPGGLLKAIKFVYGNLQNSTEPGQPAEQELKALSRVKAVRHPFILSLERFDIVHGQLIIVTELADCNLWDRLQQCRNQGLHGIPREELLRYMEEAAEALDLMNSEYQLQHLDIKPQNLFLVHNHVKVADFGLVKDIQATLASVPSGVTPLYAAPETFDNVSSRFCDQYSLAIVYQELLTGQRPFAGTTPRQLLLQHLQAPPDVSLLPPGDRDPIVRGLAKDANARHPSCTALVRALRQATSPAPLPADDGSPPPAEQTSQASPAARAETEPEPGGTSETPGGAAAVPPAGPPKRQSRLLIALPAALREKARAALASPPRPAGKTSSPPTPMDTADVQGDGVLFPALVIAAGRSGLHVLQEMRANLHARFGSLATLPHLRMLYLATDPEGVRAALECGSDRRLDPQEIVRSFLNRAAHFLKPGEPYFPLEPWFDPQLLYCIPRSHLTAGLRALGRLAFHDNYRTIVQQLRQALTACLDRDGLATADRKTQLGIRSHKPRVYVVTSLAGGTGGGVFLDLACVARQVLRQLGQTQPQVVGLFLVPHVERHGPPTRAVANTVAALTELNHFSSTGTAFRAHYDSKEPPVAERERPFHHCVLLPGPLDHEEASVRESAGLAAGFLVRELTTSLGRVTDEHRLRAAGPDHGGGLRCRTLGTYRLWWPRRVIRRQATRFFCQRLLRQWMTDDAAPIRESLRACVAEQWDKQELAPERLASHLEAVYADLLNRAPAGPLSATLEALAAKGPQNDHSAFLAVIQRMGELVGWPTDDSPAGRGRVGDGLHEATKTLLADRQQTLAQWTVGFVEEPQFRLAGAEEAVQQISARLDEVIRTLEPELAEHAKQAAVQEGLIQGLLPNLQSVASKGWRKPTAAQLVELLQRYLDLRCQSLLLDEALALYRGLAREVPELLREIRFCRTRLGELLEKLHAADGRARDSSQLGPGRHVLPAACRSLDQAIGQFLQQLTPDDSLKLDQRIQGAVQRQLSGLVTICHSGSHVLKNLATVVWEQVEGVVDQRLGKGNAADMYLGRQAPEPELLADLAAAWEEAVLELAPAKDGDRAELRLAALPVGPAGEALASLVRQALPEVEPVAVRGLEDIVLHREQTQVSLADLPQMSPRAVEAYRHMRDVEQLPPHSRMDITDWQEGSEAVHTAEPATAE